jgi:hypothetical protein
MEIKDMNIFQKMAAITAELKAVEKDLTVQTTKTSSYKAVSERGILDAVKPLEEKYGIYSFPVSREVLESNLIQNESVYEDAKGNKTTTPKTAYMTRIKTVYRFVNIDVPSQFIDTITFAEGIDSQDKGSGKAMTYADKYALMKSYKISTGEDVDEGTDAETLEKSLHSIFVIKDRCQEAYTNAIKKKMSTTDIAQALEMTEDEVKAYFSYFDILHRFEQKLNAL